MNDQEAEKRRDAIRKIQEALIKEQAGKTDRSFKPKNPLALTLPKQESFLIPPKIDLKSRLSDNSNQLE